MAADAAKPPRAGFLPFSPPPLSPAGGRGAQLWVCGLLWVLRACKRKKALSQGESLPEIKQTQGGTRSPYLLSGVGMVAARAARLGCMSKLLTRRCPFIIAHKERLVKPPSRKVSRPHRCRALGGRGVRSCPFTAPQFNRSALSPRLQNLRFVSFSRGLFAPAPSGAVRKKKQTR